MGGASLCEDEMTIPIPSPPTDNLYKFVALVGLLLLSYGLVMPHWILADFHREYNDKLDRLSGLFRELQEKIPDKSPEELMKLRGVSRTAGFLWAENYNFQKWNRDKEDLVSQQRSDLQACSWFGGILLAAGTVLWYVTLQRFQDRQIRAETRVKERQLAQAPIPAGEASDMAPPQIAEAGRKQPGKQQAGARR